MKKIRIKGKRNSSTPTGIHIELSPKLFKQFTGYCKRHGVTKKWQISQLIKQWMRYKHEK